MRNTYCFTTAKLVARNRLNVTSYVYILSSFLPLDKPVPRDIPASHTHTHEYSRDDIPHTVLSWFRTVKKRGKKEVGRVRHTVQSKPDPHTRSLVISVSITVSHFDTFFKPFIKILNAFIIHPFRATRQIHLILLIWLSLGCFLKTTVDEASH
jgi:hypothetical protein